MAWLYSCLCWTGCLLAPPTLVADQRLERFEFTQVHMGSELNLTFYAADRQSATAAAQAAFARVGELNERLSDYLPDSELNRFCRTAGSGKQVPLSDDLYCVLEAAQQLARQTGGAFDVTVGPYTSLWRRARRRKQLPSPQRLEQARAAVGYQHLRLEPCRRTGTLRCPHMQLDLGGIAKGYAADEALCVLTRHGICRALVDASGDIAVSGPPPGRPGWQITLAALAGTPQAAQPLLLAHAAVATSGDAWQHVTIDGRRYSHIVDPATGLGLTTPRTVAVVARRGLLADALASALSVLGPEKGLGLVQRLGGIGAVVVEQTEDGIVVVGNIHGDRTTHGGP